MPTSTQVRRVLLQLEEEGADDVELKLDQIKAKSDELAAAHPELKPTIDKATATAQARALREELRSILKPDIPVEVTAEDERALATLDDLKARLDTLSAGAADIKVKADDKEAQAALLRLQARMDELKRKVVDPKFELSGVLKAQAEMAALDLELDKLKEKASAAGGSQGIISRLLSGDGEGGLSGMLEKIPLLGGGLSKITSGFGEMASSAEEAGSGIGSIGGGVAIIAALAVALGAAVTAADALATGMIAAQAGLGAFALLAMPFFSSVTQAYAKIQKDQDAYNDALTATAKNTALKKLHQDYKALDPAQRSAVGGLQHLMDAFHKASKAFEPTALVVFNGGLKIAGQLLPYVAQFAQAVTPQIEGLVKWLSKGIDSTQFKQFANYLKGLSGPALAAVGSGMKGIGKDLLDLFTIMSKKDVINAVNIMFRLLGAAISSVIFVVRVSMGAWDALTAGIHHAHIQLDDARHAFATGGHDIAHAFDVVRHAAAVMGHDVAHVFDVARHDVASWGHWTAGIFDQVRHEIASWGHDIAHVFDEARHTIATWMHDAAHYFDVARHGAATMGHDIASTFDRIRHTIAAWADDVGRFVSRAVSWFRGLPGRIRSAVGNLGSLLYRAGVNVIDGLIRGIESRVGGVISSIGRIAGIIRAHLPFSPAKMGPLSGAGSPELAGRKIASMLADGLGAGTPGVTAAVGRMARGAGLTGIGAGARGAGLAAGASGGQAARLQIEWVGGQGANQQFLTWLMRNLRIRGANVAVVGGAVG